MEIKKQKTMDKENIEKEMAEENIKSQTEDTNTNGNDDVKPEDNINDEDTKTTADSEDNQQEEKDPLKKALEEIEVLKDKYLRSVAEFDNYRKRTLKEKTELILNGSEKAVKAFLPILDDMERAIDSSENSDDIEAIREGMKLIYQKTTKTMESIGVKKIDTTDADFDTDFHEAVAMVPGMGDDKKGKILDCVQAGYTLNEKVIRHAKVAVGQ